MPVPVPVPVTADAAPAAAATAPAEPSTAEATAVTIAAAAVDAAAEAGRRCGPGYAAAVFNMGVMRANVDYVTTRTARVLGCPVPQVLPQALLPRPPQATDAVVTQAVKDIRSCEELGSLPQPYADTPEDAATVAAGLTITADGLWPDGDFDPTVAIREAGGSRCVRHLSPHFRAAFATAEYGPGAAKQVFCEGFEWATGCAICAVARAGRPMRPSLTSTLSLVYFALPGNTVDNIDVDRLVSLGRRLGMSVGVGGEEQTGAQLAADSSGAVAGAAGHAEGELVRTRHTMFSLCMARSAESAG